MTPAQLRAARGLLRWTQDDLAVKAEVSVVAIRTFEIEKSAARRSTLRALRQTLEAAGVEFIPENGGGPGVRLREASAAS